METEKRKHLRVASQQYVEFENMDNNAVISQGVGRTMNISRDGILLETDSELESADAIVVHIALNEEILSLQGTTVFTQKTDEHQWMHGIRFHPLGDDVQQVLDDFIRLFDDGIKEELTSEDAPKPNLRNLVFMLSKEHKIIVDYVIGYQRIMDQVSPAPRMELLFSALNNDLDKHFAFEEQVIYKTALQVDPPEAIETLIYQLTAQHKRFRQDIPGIKAQLKKASLAAAQEMDQDLKKVIIEYFERYKQHVKDELEKLIPWFEKPPQNKLLIKYLLVAKGIAGSGKGASVADVVDAGN